MGVVTILGERVWLLLVFIALDTSLKLPNIDAFIHSQWMDVLAHLFIPSVSSRLNN